MAGIFSSCCLIFMLIFTGSSGALAQSREMTQYSTIDVLLKGVYDGFQGLPLPPIAHDRHIERSAFALRAHTSQREAGKSTSRSEVSRSSRSVILTWDMLHFPMRLTFGLPPTAPALIAVLSGWLHLVI